MSKKILYTEGQQVGTCTFVKENAQVKGIRFADFICHCGKEFTSRLNCVSLGHTKSCGCLQIEVYKKSTHGKAHSREYNIWSGIKRRCYNTNDAAYSRYGGKGIVMCNSWKDSFENFYNDMGNSPTNKHSIDRIENKGNYEKSNCRWATDKEQANNKTNNIFFEVSGIKLSIYEWAEKLNVTMNTLKQRKHRGWTDYDIINVPFRNSPNVSAK